MDALRRTFGQFLTLYRGMAPSQRLTLLLLPVLVVGALGYLMYNGQSSSYTALSWGKTFTTEELMTAEQALINAGLNEFRREGQRLMAPKADVERYNAALLEHGGLPTDYFSDLEAKVEKQSIFASKQQSEMLEEIALGKELRRSISAIPGIRDASVLWSPPKTRGWADKSPVTATVNILPEAGHDLSRELVQSLRVAVAAAIPNLKPDNVVIFDQLNSRAYTADNNDPFDNQLLTRINDFNEMYRGKIAEALSYIDGVLITVNVDLDNLKSHVMREQTVDAKKSATLQSSEQSRTNESSRQGTGGEPGVVKNAGRSLAPSTTAEQMQRGTESNTSTLSAPSFIVAEKEFTAAMPKAVQVGVAIPEDYFQKAIAQAGSGDAGGSAAPTKEQILTDVKAMVAQAIGSSPDEGKIVVTSYLSVPKEVTVPTTTITQTVTNVLAQWGGAIGLGLFALWALRMLSKSTTKLPEADPNAVATPTLAFTGTTEDEPEQPHAPPQQATRRDELQTVVRDNPEMAAAVLSKWIQKAR